VLVSDPISRFGPTAAEAISEPDRKFPVELALIEGPGRTKQIKQNSIKLEFRSNNEMRTSVKWRTYKREWERRRGRIC
jgi:hypothetical protein